MALITIPISEARRAARYTGTNSAELNEAIDDLSIVSESPQGLVFTSGGQQYTVVPNGYVAWYQGEVTDVFQNQDDFDEVYQSLELSHVHDLTLTTGPGRLG